MSAILLRRVVPLPLLLLLHLTALFPARAAAAPAPAGVLREVYTSLGGSTLADLTNSPAFPARPSVEEILADFEAPSEWAENYGQRLRALLLPPATGNYVFWIASDDQGALFLGTDESPSSRRRIAWVNNWTSSREWTKETNQKSAAIPLVAGRRYYLEALQKEGGGGDNLSVRWQLPNGTIIEPIRGSNLVVVGLSAPVITAPPTNTTVIEGGYATFSVGLDRVLGARFQWWRDDQPVPGATNMIFGFGPVSLADSGRRFRVAITNGQGSATSPAVLLTVARDVTPPTVVSVVNLGDPRRVTVLFSESIEPASATRAGNYALDRGAQVLAARLAPDGRSVVLETSLLAAEGDYLLNVRNVRDLAAAPNPVPAGAGGRFSLAFTPLDPARIEGSPENLGPSTRRGPILISEIHYHPPRDAGGRNLGFIEIHNPQPWSEDIGGWRISGDVDLSFPAGTLVPARGYLVAAAEPADLEAVHGLSGALRYSGSLGHDGGVVRLRNRQDAVMWEVRYRTEPPWPVAPDGGGHSLVLARPSLGESDPRAWSASDQPGGSPGTAEPSSTRPARTVRINEVLAHTDEPQRDFIELYNYGADPMPLADCALTDDPTTNRFLLPADTVVPPRGFVVFDQTQLGFALDSRGETIWFRHVPTGRVLDVLRFPAQANGVALGRSPDGAPDFTPLATPTPGTANTAPAARPVYLSEVRYEPAGGETAAEFVEIHNAGAEAVPFGGWRLEGGVEFTFPDTARLPAGGFLVVAKDPALLRSRHPQLEAELCFGPYSGSLGNRGDRLRLTQPDLVISTNATGAVITNRIHCLVDEAEYQSGGRWPRWAAGGGSSLVRVDSRIDGRRAAAWAASDESARSDWVTVEATGTSDLGISTASSLELMLLGAGECLIDDVEVFRSGEANRVPNASFSGGLAPWVPQGNQSHSEWLAAGGIGGSPCLLLRATGRGDTANRVRVPLSAAIPSGAKVTLRARARWLRGSSEFLMRLHGNWLEAATNILTTRALGTPGQPPLGPPAPSGPSIDDVRHQPVLPAARQDVTVTARVSDPDGLATLVLRYRLDPATNWTGVAMTARGAGYYSAVIPGQPLGTLAAFHLEAWDAAPDGSAVSRFPADAPDREALVRWGEPSASSSFGSYRVWATQRTIDAWTRRERLSNDLLDVTAVIGRDRVVYNTGVRYSGSPYHSPGYDSPLGNFCDYQLTFPEDDLAFGETDINLLLPGNGCCEGTMVREPMAYAIARGLGLPYNHTRPVHVFLNGQRRAPMLMLDSQQANGDFVAQWWPEPLPGSSGGDGDLHKIALWFEFNDDVTSFEGAGASFGNFTSGGKKKLARYRWNWPRRAAPYAPNNYTNLYALHDAMLTTATGAAYTQRIEQTLDPDNWARTVAVEHLIGNTDSFAYGGGQNMFVYRPDGGRWSWLLWDIDFAFQAEAATNTVFNFGGAELDRFLHHPPFFRRYYRALQEALDGPLSATFANAFLDARYNAFRSAGFSPESPQSIKNYLAGRRSYLQRELARMNFTLRLVSTPEQVATANPIAIAGVAPLAVETIAVNGEPWPVQWTSVSNWTLRLPLTRGVHALTLQGLDPTGHPVGGSPVVMTVDFRGDDDPAVGTVFVNEWMADNRTTLADPADGRFDDWLELHNAASVPVSLSNYALGNSATNRAQWRFPVGTTIDPHGFLLVWADGETNQTAAGALHASFRLNRGGESIAFFNSGGLLLDQVRFGAQSPDVSEGRFPDGGEPAGILLHATPGSANAPGRAEAATQLDADWSAAEHTVKLSWPSLPGLHYRVETATDLDAGAWEIVLEFPATGPSSSVTLDPGSGPRRFYRVVVP